MTSRQSNMTLLPAWPLPIPAQDQASFAPRILLWGLGLLGVIVAAGVGLLCFWRRLAASHSPAPATFSMQALEAMRTSGELSEEQFRRLRRAALPLDIAAMTPQRDEDANCALSPPCHGDDEDN